MSVDVVRDEKFPAEAVTVVALAFPLTVRVDVINDECKPTGDVNVVALAVQLTVRVDVTIEPVAVKVDTSSDDRFANPM